MITEIKTTIQNLYQIDYYLWLEETLRQLENKDFNAIDLENLIDEVSDLSRREKRRLESLVKRLFEHLLKIKYWESEKVYNEKHWKKEIRNFRQQIKKELQVSPSLKNYTESILNECYYNARNLFSDGSEIPLDTLPENPIANLEEILDENWFPS
jgi:hypothetical protein